MSKNCRRLIDRLEIEHMAHAGLGNGDLILTHLQMVEFGISRRLIQKTIAEAEDRGLIEVQRGLRLKDVPNRFRLTYRGTRRRLHSLAYEWSAPTNEWRQRGKQTQECGSTSAPQEGHFAPGENKPENKSENKSPENPAETANVFRSAKDAQSGTTYNILLPPAQPGAPSRENNHTPRRANGQQPPSENNRAGLDALRGAVVARIEEVGRGEQQRIAEHLGITRGSLSNFLAGRRSIRETTERALREYLSRDAA
jgi:hypothetical protein